VRQLESYKDIAGVALVFGKGQINGVFDVRDAIASKFAVRSSDKILLLFLINDWAVLFKWLVQPLFQMLSINLLCLVLCRTLYHGWPNLGLLVSHQSSV
jgi:hypothetical protein